MLNILIGGEAGQGLVTVGQLLTRSLIRSGCEVVVSQTYQSRIRGGHNSFSILVGTSPLAAPREEIDLLVALDDATPAIHRDNLSKGGLLILDEEGNPAGLSFLRVPYRELAQPRFRNVVALGVISGLLDLEEGLVERTLSDMLGEKKPERAADNRRALAEAFSWASGRQVPLERLALPAKIPRRLMMNGNEAIAMGALCGGVRFCAFYPMTPSTSIALALSDCAAQMGLLVEQAEDEIAAVNMAIGASFAGAPSIVPTSGGGFALMVEGVSLAAMTETPLVIVVAQRPGPATGLPTRTEQADLEFVLHAGHGEFPRIIMAPGTVEECFHLTRRAFDLAERYQGPVFILTDQFLADSYRAVEPFEVSGAAVPRPADEKGESPIPYCRYALTEEGISPRLLPGRSKNLVVADSDEHGEEGHLTEDLALRARMVEKRLKKGEGIRREVIPPALEGDPEADLLLVSWGSSGGAASEAAALLRSEGQPASTLHFSQVWPLVPEHFLDSLRRAGRVIAVEGNATGQLARLIRRESGFEIREKVLRYDGLPLTPEYIMEKVCLER